MRITLPKDVYTQINSDQNDYLFQNLSNSNIQIIVSTVEPQDGTGHDYELKPLHGIGSKDIVGICWGKPSGDINAVVGLIEG